MLLITYIIVELLRLLLVSIMVATGLLLIKQNTMDIGLLIGASVAGGFFLLGMFYLWLCAANLPIVINETEREEQASVIDTLRQVLEIDNPRRIPRGLEDISFKPIPSNNGGLKEIHTIPHGLKKRISPQIIHSRPFRY